MCKRLKRWWSERIAGVCDRGEVEKKPSRRAGLDDRVFSILKQELDAAKERHEQARENFWKVSGSSRVPGLMTGLPHPDGSQLVRNAAREEAQARNEHLEALRRINACLIHGTIPDDLEFKRKSIN